MFFTQKQIPEEKWFISDAKFNELYPSPVQQLARRHWTPLKIAQAAAGFLVAEPKARILDIGSGVGKFCLAAAYYNPGALFYGIEQRELLVQYSENARKKLGFQNVTFIHGNFTQISLKAFDHFYFYNSFYENLADTDKIDDSIDYSGELYNYYTRYLFKQLKDAPAGTKLVTYYSMEDEIPDDFLETDNLFEGVLKFWIKA